MEEAGKICLIGAYAVGKSALVRRCLGASPPASYRCTLGLSISRASIPVQGRAQVFSLWDFQGSGSFGRVNVLCLREADALIFVADGTRMETLRIALDMRDQVLGLTGDLPNALLLNKADLKKLWEIPENSLDELAGQGIKAVKSSAATGLGVTEVFANLAAETLAKTPPPHSRSYAPKTRSLSRAALQREEQS
ncbi:MAG: hypothetical protein LBN33_03150 [Desulfovibrio sp.]|jgi:small GTP-binding protein|nr:hypothetical protein [Desulfovibrio sp.]